jgi:c-di-GMP-binding flagellar brake protein YcgR
MAQSNSSDREIGLEEALALMMPDTRLNLEIFEGPFRGIVSAILLKKEKKRIHVSYPCYMGHPIPVRREAGVNITVRTNNRCMVIRGEIEGIVKEDAPILVIRLSSKGGLWTRERQFKRMRAEIPFIARRIDRRERLAFAGKTVDVSGNGFLFETRRTLPVGTRLRVDLKIPKAPAPLPSIVRVTRVTVDPARDPKINLVAVAFDEISLEDQDRLVHHIFELEWKDSAEKRPPDSSGGS